jgi:uncharacterized protein YdaU (DUF1376 family)
MITSLEKGSDYKIVIDLYKGKRTLPQNDLLFGYIYKAIADYTGYRVDEIHELMGYTFLLEEKEIMGKKVNYIKSTTQLTVEEFGHYTENVMNFFRGYGVEFSGL